MLLHDPNELLDVARIATDHQRSEIPDRRGERAGCPLKRRLAPSEQAGLIGLDAAENPVSHLRVDDDRAYIRDFQRIPPERPPGVYPYLRACSSAMITAAINSTPFATIWKNVGTLVRIKPLSSTPMIRTPNSPPMMVPLPPVSAHPPRTAAVMASNSRPSDPEIGCPDPVRAASSMPANPAVAPLK